MIKPQTIPHTHLSLETCTGKPEWTQSRMSRLSPHPTPPHTHNTHTRTHISNTHTHTHISNTHTHTHIHIHTETHTPVCTQTPKCINFHHVRELDNLRKQEQCQKTHTQTHMHTHTHTLSLSLSDINKSLISIMFEN